MKKSATFKGKVLGFMNKNKNLVTVYIIVKISVINKIFLLFFIATHIGDTKGTWKLSFA